MSETESALQVTIWVPDGISRQHWVHRCQFFKGDFMLPASPSAGVGGPLDDSSHEPKIKEVLK